MPAFLALATHIHCNFCSLTHCVTWASVGESANSGPSTVALSAVTPYSARAACIDANSLSAGSIVTVIGIEMFSLIVAGASVLTRTLGIDAGCASKLDSLSLGAKRTVPPRADFISTSVAICIPVALFVSAGVEYGVSTNACRVCVAVGVGVAVSGEGITSGVDVLLAVLVGTKVGVGVDVEVVVGGMTSSGVGVLVGRTGVLVINALAVAEAIASAVAVIIPISSSV